MAPGLLPGSVARGGRGSQASAAVRGAASGGTDARQGLPGPRPSARPARRAGLGGAGGGNSRRGAPGVRHRRYGRGGGSRVPAKEAEFLFLYFSWGHKTPTEQNWKGLQRLLAPTLHFTVRSRDGLKSPKPQASVRTATSDPWPHNLTVLIPLHTLSRVPRNGLVENVGA